MDAGRRRLHRRTRGPFIPPSRGSAPGLQVAGRTVGGTITTSADSPACPVPLLLARELRHADRALARGQIVRVARGVYAPADMWRALQPWERYAARVHAAATRYPDAVFVLESACALLGLPVFGEPEHVHVLGGAADTSRVVDGVRWHTTAADREIVERHGVLVSTPADLAVDTARSRHPAVALAVADAVLRAAPALDREQLCARNEQRQSSRGRRRARWPLGRATPIAESTFESVSRAAIEWLGFPAPELQASFLHPDGGADRVDFWWPDRRIAGEADGDLKYDGRFGEPVDLLRERRRRDARLLAQGVSATAHWAWSDALAADPLFATLRAAGLRPVAPRDHAPLHALRRIGAMLPTARLQ